MVARWGSGAGASATSKASPAEYYLALGDSLSTGVGATPGRTYVDDIYADESVRIPNLQLANLGCAGDTTTRMIRGGLCHDYQTGDQLGDAEEFLAKHRGHVAFVTIDVGGDDIIGCAVKTASINPTCVTRALSKISTNLPTILSGLRKAGGKVAIVGMSYYDPALAADVTGPPFFPGNDNQTLARASLSMLDRLNKELQGIYERYGVAVANGQEAFHSSDWKDTGFFDGRRVPQNVADICNWTHMCTTDGARPNIHTNDIGHGLLASAFESALEPLLHRSNHVS